MKNIVWIIIVNYRTADLAIDCLHSLSTQVVDLGNIHVAVVDNNSGDSSLSKLATAIKNEGWTSWTDLVPLEKNGGFAYGNNASIRHALSANQQPDYILLLNPDTVALKGMISALVQFMDTHPKVGIAGSQLETPEGSIDISAHNFPTPLSELESSARLGILSRLLRQYLVSPPSIPHSHPCDWVSGACMIIRNQVFRDIGLMDELFFLYFEEVDFCRRARQADWECWHVPDSRVIHLEGASTGISAVSKRRAAYWYNSRRRFFVKSYGILGLFAADMLWAMGYLSFLLRKKLRLGAKNCSNSDPKWFMFDLLWGDLRAFLNGSLFNITQPVKRA